MITWKTNIFKADAEKVANEIDQISKQNGVGPDESINAKDYVSWARNNPNSESYKCFDWNDTTAAEKWRIKQARDIMCNLVFVEDKSEENDIVSEPTSIRLMYGTYDNNTYKKPEIILQNPDEYKKLLERGKEELKSFKERYKTIKEFQNIIAMIP